MRFCQKNVVQKNIIEEETQISFLAQGDLSSFCFFLLAQICVFT
jgi:hypothetical protein